MDIQPGYDPEKKCITLSVRTYMITRYFQNLKGMIKECSDTPKNTEVVQVDDDTALIKFPAESSGSIVKSSDNKMAVGVNVVVMETFQNIINTFMNCALRKELKTTEFIPLYGYSIDNLKEDIQVAVKNKRKFCIIKDYSEYLAIQNKKVEKYEFHQVMVEVGTPEYTDVAILLYQKKIDELREMFEKKLKLENWC